MLLEICAVFSADGQSMADKVSKEMATENLRTVDPSKDKLKSMQALLF